MGRGISTIVAVLALLTPCCYGRACSSQRVGEEVDFAELSPSVEPRDDSYLAPPENMTTILTNSALDERPYAAIDSGDLDNDGDADLVLFGNFGGLNKVIVMLNDGTGDYATKTVSQFPVRIHMTPPENDFAVLTLSDVEGDGDLDVIVGTLRKNGEAFGLYKLINDGRGGFTKAPAAVTQ